MAAREATPPDTGDVERAGSENSALASGVAALSSLGGGAGSDDGRCVRRVVAAGARTLELGAVALEAVARRAPALEAALVTVVAAPAPAVVTARAVVVAVTATADDLREVALGKDVDVRAAGLVGLDHDANPSLDAGWLPRLSVVSCSSCRASGWQRESACFLRQALPGEVTRQAMDCPCAYCCCTV